MTLLLLYNITTLLYITTVSAFVIAALVIQVYAALEGIPLRETVMDTLISGVVAAGAAGLIYLVAAG